MPTLEEEVEKEKEFLIALERIYKEKGSEETKKFAKTYAESKIKESAVEDLPRVGSRLVDAFSELDSKVITLNVVDYIFNTYYLPAFKKKTDLPEYVEIEGIISDAKEYYKVALRGLRKKYENKFFYAHAIEYAEKSKQEVDYWYGKFKEVDQLYQELIEEKQESKNKNKKKIKKKKKKKKVKRNKK